MDYINLELAEECFKKARITGDLCANSVIKYRESAKRFFKSIGDKKFEDIELEDFDDFILKAQDRGNSNSGILSVIHAMKWIIKNLKNQGIIKYDIDLAKITKPKIKKREVNYLTREEISHFLGVIEREINQGAVIRKFRTMALYIFLLETGARIDEALSIKISDIDFKNREVSIIGKGGKPRVLLFHDKSHKWIKEYLSIKRGGCEYLFATLNGKSKWSYNDVCRSFQRYKKLSGIKKDFSIHTFRHTFATQLLLNGVPINQVSFLLGHANLETTMKYYIGTIKKEEAKKFIRDRHFDFIPESALKVNALKKIT